MAVENRLHRVFAAQPAGQGGLWPFLTAGYPDLPSTTALLLELQTAGAAGIEVGVPYSDPIADGPVIQTSYTRALDKGVRVAGIFEAISAARAGGLTLPVLAMVSDSIVFRVGAAAFAAQAKAAGVDGLIVPDLSLEEAGDVSGELAKVGLTYCPLVAPTTPPDRAERIARLATGFTYYMTVAGVTGERRALPTELAANVQRLRTVSQRPVCVGFGISTADQVAAVARVADGVIVGSAIVRRINDAVDRGETPAQIVPAVGRFVRELLGR